MNIYIGLGSNLQDPCQQLQQALESIVQHPEINILKISSFYSNKPIGPQDQPDYVNAVAKLNSSLSPQSLLTTLQQIERQQGRVRKQRWHARTIDIDILLYDNQIIDQPHLIIPHPQMAQRRFVLYPLAEIEPDLTLPNGKAIKELLTTCPKHDLFELQIAEEIA